MSDKKNNPNTIKRYLTSKPIKSQEKNHQVRFDGPVSDLNRVLMRGVESVGQVGVVLKPLLINGVEVNEDDYDVAALLALVKERKKAKEVKEEERRKEKKKRKKRKRRGRTTRGEEIEELK